MANTFKVSKINELGANSQDSSTGEITTTQIQSGDAELTVDVSDNVTDVDGATIFTVSRLEGTLPVADFDFCFVDTMNDGSTLEDAMAARELVYVRLALEGGELQTSSGSNRFEVRPVVMPDLSPGSDEDFVTGMLEFTHSDHGGVQRPA